MTVLPPDPFTAIRATTLHATRGANYWSPRPVTRLDLAVGAYDEISSAEVPGFAEALLRALPGLVEHRCSVGERGGFVLRLGRGTYAPHIVEHVALELQGMIGHDVGYGRTRGGDAPGEYTVVFEYRHEAVGLRAAALALETVQRAFAGTLESVAGAVRELAAIARTPSPAPPRRAVLCGVTGSGGGRALALTELRRRGPGQAGEIVDVAPAELLVTGLPYTRSELALIVDAEPTDVPERYRERDRASRLVSVVAEAVPETGTVVLPATAREVREYVRQVGCRVALFTDGGAPPSAGEGGDDVVAVAWVADGRVRVGMDGETSDAGALRADAAAAPQLAAALAAAVARSGTRAGENAVSGAEEGD